MSLILFRSWIRHSILSGILLSSGCGTVGIDSEDRDASPTASDASGGGPTRDAAPSDAAEEPGPRCDPTAPFDGATPVAELNGQGAEDGALDEYARLSRDELTAYFSTDRAGGFDIYVAERSDPDEAFGEPAPLLGVNTSLPERVPTVTADGLSLFATQENPNPDQPSVLDYRIVGATRPDLESNFGPLEFLANVNGVDVEDVDPYVVSDGRALYFSSSRSGRLHLFRSARSGTDYDAPEPVGGTTLSETSSEDSPVVTDDELTIYFASNYTGVGDIYVATRASAFEAFGPPEPVGKLNTKESREWPSWISPDGCLLYFSRSDGNAEVGYDIYVARRAP